MSAAPSHDARARLTAQPTPHQHDHPTFLRRPWRTRTLATPIRCGCGCLPRAHTSIRTRARVHGRSTRLPVDDHEVARRRSRHRIGSAGVNVLVRPQCGFAAHKLQTRLRPHPRAKVVHHSAMRCGHGRLVAGPIDKILHHRRASLANATKPYTAWHLEEVVCGSSKVACSVECHRRLLVGHRHPRIQVALTDDLAGA